MLEYFMALRASAKIGIYVMLFIIITFLYWVVLPPNFLVPALYVIPLFLVAIGTPWKKGWVVIPLTVLLGIIRDQYFLSFPTKVLIHKYVVVNIALIVMFVIGSKLKTAYDKLNAAKQELELMYNKEKQLANMDYLTGIGNHRFFQQNLVREVKWAQEGHYQLSLIIFDLDNFKRFNDDFGHQAGDMLLNNVGTTIKSCIRETDIACRYGGEEFVVILPKASGMEAREVAERIRKAVEAARLFVGEGNPEGCGVTISGGVATFPEEAENGVELIRMADEKLYSVKRGNKNQVA